MKTKLLLSIVIIFCGKIIVAQNVNTNNATHQTLTSANINKKLNDAFNKSKQQIPKQQQTNTNQQSNHSTASVLKKIEEVKHLDYNKLSHPVGGAKIYDTVFVGVVPHDTMRITGNYTHNGPIFVFNDGVLIIHNAIVNNTGDLFVFQYGRVFVDSSQVTFPQQYFYQRSVIAVQHGYINFHYSTFDYSGMSHNLVMGDSANVVMNLVHNYDWTTAGMFGSPTVYVRGSNLGGEYILSGNAQATFNNVDTLLLWHQFPNSSVVNYAFPSGAVVYGYQFNNTVAGISGINYNVSADTCYNVWWAMMPTNGSDITISNSTVRAIGAWFERGDSVTVTGVNDNSNYTNFVMPVTDRNLHLINTAVQTWSFYVFDSSKINISNCNLGEVGTQQRASVNANNFLLDGSGGYFWATDTSVIVSANSTVYSTVRSERNGIFVFAYGYMPFQGPTSIGNSLMVSVQNNIAVDPIPYDGSIAWMENIESPNTAHADSLITVTGSAWIDQGPNGSWMDWMNYSLSYQLQGNTGWTYIVHDSTTEIRHAALGKWNTTGLAAGTYILRLVNTSNLLDTVEDFKAVTILPAVTVNVDDNLDNIVVNYFPNPATNQFQISSSKQIERIKITNVLGETVYESSTKLNNTTIDIHNFDKGVYFIETTVKDKKFASRLVKE